MSHEILHQEIKEKSSFISSGKGIKAMKFSFFGMLMTSSFQAGIFLISGSVALLADTMHNFADAFSAIPLWIAFWWARKKPTNRFTYGYQRFEDIAGIFIVLLIFGTALLIGIDSVSKIKSGHVVKNIPWVVLASVIGFIGNEWVARYRIKIGKEIKSQALIADGQHARADGFTSLGVLAGAAGVWLGYPLADPIVGIFIAFLIVHIGWSSGQELFQRLADAIPPEKVEHIKELGSSVDGVLHVSEVRARYVGRDLRVELTIAVSDKISVLEGHEIAIAVQHQLEAELPDIVSPSIHVDPESHMGEEHHYDPHHQLKAPKKTEPKGTSR